MVDVDEFEFGGGGIVVEILVGNADRQQVRLPRHHRHAPLDIDTDRGRGKKRRRLGLSRVSFFCVGTKWDRRVREKVKEIGRVKKWKLPWLQAMQGKSATLQQRQGWYSRPAYTATWVPSFEWKHNSFG